MFPAALKLIAEAKPSAVLLENVQGLAAAKFSSYRNDLLIKLNKLGYQAESGPWRSFYLTGAQELRNGTPHAPGARGAVSVDVMREMTATMVLDYCAIKLNGPRAADSVLCLDVELTDRGEARRVHVAHGVLRHRPVDGGAAATVVRTTIPTLIDLASELCSVAEAEASGAVRVTGPAEPLTELIALLDQFDLFFPIIEP